MHRPTDELWSQIKNPQSVLVFWVYRSCFQLSFTSQLCLSYLFDVPVRHSLLIWICANRVRKFGLLTYRINLRIIQPTVHNVILQELTACQTVRISISTFSGAVSQALVLSSLLFLVSNRTHMPRSADPVKQRGPVTQYEHLRQENSSDGYILRREHFSVGTNNLDCFTRFLAVA